jgi:pimeloyl-ACP methyl ester carboxylesterase
LSTDPTPDHVGVVSGSAFQVETSAGPLTGRDTNPTDEGPALVFLQGFLAAPEVWHDVIEQLRPRYRCITVDWPFGAHHSPMRADADLSPPGIARLVIEVLDGLGLAEAVLIGNDSGGTVTQLVIAEHPDRVAASVLIACDAFEVFPPGVFRFVFPLARFPVMVWLLAKAFRWPPLGRSRLGFGAVLRHDAGRALPWIVPAASDPRIRRDVAKLMTGSSRTQTLGAATRFAAFDRPVLVVWAADDRLFPASLGERLARAFPHATLAVVEDSATFVGCDQPGKLSALIDDHLRALAA